MIQLKLMCILIILASLFSCEMPVTFDDPQPTDTANLSKFPNRLKGQYLSLRDSSTLIISDKVIEIIYDYDYKIHPNELDRTSRISGDTIYDINRDEHAIIRQDGDSLMIHIHNIDTLFLIDYDNVVRKFKGFYFLNIRYDKTSWLVKKVQLSKGELIISSISTKQELDNLKEITETPQDTVHTYNFTATKKQFKEFIKKDGFSDSQIFVKQMKNGL